MKKLVVAIFEDDEVNRFIYQNLLKVSEDRLDVHVFDSPEKGYAVAREIQFDVVFIETHFWGQNFFGVNILNKLKEVSAKKFVSVAVTALLQDGDIERIIGSGFTICMEKPLSFESIARLQELQ